MMILGNGRLNSKKVKGVGRGKKGKSRRTGRLLWVSTFSCCAPCSLTVVLQGEDPPLLVWAYVTVAQHRAWSQERTHCVPVLLLGGESLCTTAWETRHCWSALSPFPKGK